MEKDYEKTGVTTAGRAVNERVSVWYLIVLQCAIAVFMLFGLV